VTIKAEKIMQETEAKKIIVTLLAREQALFRPFRRVDWATRGATSARWQLQQVFRARGLHWFVGGAEAERKVGERALKALAAAKLITRAGRQKNVFARLTEKARWLACALADAPTPADGFAALAELQAHAPTGNWVSELLPSGIVNYAEPDATDKLFAFQIGMLPALVAGWAESNSDCHGRAAYRVTAAGDKALTRAAPSYDGELPPVDDKIADHFWREYAAEKERLLAAEPENQNEIGQIPLSAGGWSEIAGPWKVER